MVAGKRPKARATRGVLFCAAAIVGVILAASPGSAAQKKPEKKVERLTAPMTPDCPWGLTAEHACVNPALAMDAQRLGLIYSQQLLNRNFSPYLPPNANIEKQYPLPINEWWSLKVNTQF